MTQPRCGYDPCDKPATWRADYYSKSWPKPVLRCEDHGGCHSFTHRWDGAKWVEVEEQA